jgi:hypothetical protein
MTVRTPPQSLLRERPPAVYRLRHMRLHTVPNFDIVSEG